MEVKVKERQTMFDVALEYCGTFESAMQMALLNGVDLTEDIPTNAVLELPSVDKPRIAANFQSLRHTPATAITQDEINAILATGEGIGYWEIGYDFIIQ